MVMLPKFRPSVSWGTADAEATVLVMLPMTTSCSVTFRYWNASPEGLGFVKTKSASESTLPWATEVYRSAAPVPSASPIESDSEDLPAPAPLPAELELVEVADRLKAERSNWPSNPFLTD